MFSSCRADDGVAAGAAPAGPGQKKSGEAAPARSHAAPAADFFQTPLSSYFAPSGDDPFPTMLGSSLFAGGPWRAASPAAGGSPRRSESSTARDEALARALAREEADAALARRLALAPEGGLAEPWQAPASAHEAVPGHADFGTDQGMIFVACDIAGTRTEMMVDTGAQMSVISLPTARRLGLMGRLDQSQQGVAAGVGHARIYGKLRRVPIRLGHVEFELDLSVLGVDDDLLMLGIDQMHRFNVIVDLQQRCLVFGGRDGIEVPFLPPRPRVPRLSAGCPQM